MTRQEIKAKAREQLGGSLFAQNWLYAILVLLIFGAITGALSFTFVGSIIVAGPLTYGLSLIFLKLARTKDPINIGDVFKGFTDDFGGTFLLGLMQAIFIFLWSLLFVIPGIIKSYAYSMAFYIKIDHPDYDWKKCLEASEEMMKGHKMELFILELSFIGWIIVGSLACGIGTLWVSPYMMASFTNFYESIRPVESAPAPEEEAQPAV